MKLHAPIEGPFRDSDSREPLWRHVVSWLLSLPVRWLRIGSRGPCGMRFHSEDCDCDGDAGER